MRRRVKPRALLVGGAVAVVVVVVAVVAAFLLRSGGDEAGSADEVRSQLVARLAEAQARAEDGDDPGLDVVALRSELERAAPDWVVDLAASDDRTAVGVAARKLDEPVCVFLWTAVGGPRTATVTDLNLPCSGRIALLPAQ